MPSEFSGDGLHPIPSVIDLPSSAGVEVGGIGSGVSGISEFNGIKLRGAGGGANSGWATPEKTSSRQNVYKQDFQESGGKTGLEGKDGSPIKHYDADGRHPFVMPGNVADGVAFQC